MELITFKTHENEVNQSKHHKLTRQ